MTANPKLAVGVHPRRKRGLVAARRNVENTANKKIAVSQASTTVSFIFCVFHIIRLMSILILAVEAVVFFYPVIFLFFLSRSVANWEAGREGRGGGGGNGNNCNIRSNSK